MKTKKNLLLLIVALAAGIALGIFGYAKLAKSTTPDKYPTTNTNPQTGASLQDPVTPADSVYDDLANALYLICYNQPESLASTLSACPEALQNAGYDDPDPMALDQLLSDSESAKETQNQLLWLLRDILESSDTQYNYIEWSGDVRIMGMVKVDEAQPASPQNIVLRWFHDFCEGAPVLKISVPRSDGNKDVILLDLRSGFGRFEPLEDYVSGTYPELYSDK